jgi:hypothetical protein
VRAACRQGSFYASKTDATTTAGAGQDVHIRIHPHGVERDTPTNLKVALHLTRFASSYRLASFDPATANIYVLELERRMDTNHWDRSTFPANIKFAFDYSELFNSADQLRDFLNNQKSQQRTMTKSLRIKPIQALDENSKHANNIISVIRDVSSGKIVGDNTSMDIIKEAAGYYVPMKTAPFALMGSKDYTDLFAGGCMLSNHFGRQWVVDKYGWDLTAEPFDSKNWKLQARYLELEDVLDASKTTVATIEDEIEGLKLTKEKIANQEASLTEMISKVEADATERINNFVKVVIDGEALGSPGRNWQGKENIHNKYALGWFCASVVWLGLVIAGGYYGGNWIAARSVTIVSTSTVAAVSSPTPPTDKPAAPDAEAEKAAEKPVVTPPTQERLDTPLAVVFITTYVLLAISIFRFMTRQYQLEQRLADDARQRRTMMNSYLALLEHKSNPISEAERILVLQVLFRGTALTEANDEVSPANLMDALVTAVLKRDGKSPGS